MYYKKSLEHFSRHYIYKRLTCFNVWPVCIIWCRCIPHSFSTTTKFLLKNYKPCHAQDLFYFQLFFNLTFFVMGQLPTKCLWFCIKCISYQDFYITICFSILLGICHLNYGNENSINSSQHLSQILLFFQVSFL